MIEQPVAAKYRLPQWSRDSIHNTPVPRRLFQNESGFRKELAGHCGRLSLRLTH
jgi:hypothetical protein